MQTAAIIVGIILALAAVGELTAIRKALEATREIHETHLGLYAQAYASLREPEPQAEEGKRIQTEGQYL